MEKEFLTKIYTQEEIQKGIKPFLNCSDKLVKHFKSCEIMFLYCYDETLETVHRLVVVGHRNKGSEDIRNVLDNKTSCTKFNDNVKSCRSQVLGTSYITVEDVLSNGLRAARVGTNCNFSEIRKGDIRNKHLLVFTLGQYLENFYLYVVTGVTNARLLILQISDAVAQILKDETIYHFASHADIEAVSKAVSVFMTMIARLSISSMRRLDKQNGNLVLRVDSRLLYFHPEKGVNCIFTNTDTDSEQSCEMDIMWMFEGGSHECLSGICKLNELQQKDIECVNKIIDTMINNPCTCLNKIFSTIITEMWRNHVSYFSDRKAIVNGPTVEFIKCADGDKPHSVTDITTMNCNDVQTQKYDSFSLHTDEPIDPGCDVFELLYV